MSICQIRYISQNTLLISGIRRSLERIVSHHPGWQFHLSPYSADEYDTHHIMIIDGTASERDLDFPDDTLQRRNTLVLLKASQKTVMEVLVKEYRCSILCTDEFNFRMRDLLDDILRKKRYLSPLVTRFLHDTTGEEIVLTPAEYNVVKYLRQGYCGVEISRLLFRSEKTISSHKRKIMGKLGAKNDIELTKKIHSLLPESLSA